jgi:hypothetical protein
MKTNKESNNKFTSTKKKQWHKPQIQQLDVQKTLSGPNPHFAETDIQHQGGGAS